MCKYVSYLIDTLNHDTTISELLKPDKRIANLLAKHRADLEARGTLNKQLQIPFEDDRNQESTYISRTEGVKNSK